MNQISIVISDDQTLFRQGIERIICREPDFTVLGQISYGEELLSQIARKKPDILLLGVSEKDSGADSYRRIIHIKRDHPGCRVVVISDHYSEDEALRSLRFGAKGYLLKEIDAATLIKCLRSVYAGQIWAESRIMSRLLDEYSNLIQEDSTPSMDETPRLTEREYEVLKLIAQGCSNRDMAARLYISEKTIKTHLSNIFTKIEVTDRLQAALYAIRNRIVDV